MEPRYNEVLGTMKIALLYQVSHYIRVKKTRNIKSWDQKNYLVIRGFCYIRPLYNEVPLYFMKMLILNLNLLISWNLTLHSIKWTLLCKNTKLLCENIILMGKKRYAVNLTLRWKWRTMIISPSHGWKIACLMLLYRMSTLSPRIEV